MSITSIIHSRYLYQLYENMPTMLLKRVSNVLFKEYLSKSRFDVLPNCAE